MLKIKHQRIKFSPFKSHRALQTDQQTKLFKEYKKSIQTALHNEKNSQIKNMNLFSMTSKYLKNHLSQYFHIGIIYI